MFKYSACLYIEQKLEAASENVCAKTPNYLNPAFHIRVLVGKHEAKIPLRRQRHRWEDSIKMDLREMG
jgi:hypothetical protein